MRIWPIIVDSSPASVGSRGRSASLLLAPIGTNTLFEHLVQSFGPITGNPPLVVAPEDADSLYIDWIRGLCPSAEVIRLSRAVRPLALEP